MGKSRKPTKTIGTRQNDELKMQKETGKKKNYSLPQVDPPDECDDKQKKVCIAPHLEKELLRVIQQERQTRERGDVSTRFTAKKLQDMYDSLQSAGFTHPHIELGLRNTVPYGGDVIDSLDWLCLNIPNSELPDGFSNTFHEEQSKSKSRGQFEGDQIDLSAVTASQIQSQHPIDPPPVIQTNPGGASNVKSWILNYADQSSEESGEDDCGDVVNQEDLNLVYLDLVTRLAEAKSQASGAKVDGDQARQKGVSMTIRTIMDEMKILERDPQFEAVTKEQRFDLENSNKVSSKPDGNPGKKSGQKVVDERKEDETLGLGCLEKIVTQTPEPKPVRRKTEARSFEYTRQQWTGKSPKQFLLDWCSKHLGKARKPTFAKVNVSHNLHKCRLTVHQPRDTDLVLCPSLACHNMREAEHLASTLALYVLCKGQSVHQLLPPPYRDVWLEWLDADKLISDQAETETNKPRDKLITRLMADLSSVTTRDSSNKTRASQIPNDDDDDDDDVLEDWESLADHTSNEDGPLRNPKRSSHKAGVSCDGLKRLLHERMASEKYHDLLSSRQQLPVFAYKEKIVDTLRSDKVLVVSGETGCGKSTQIPQYILQDCITRGEACNVVVTEPRRISATSLATRVCAELGEAAPGSPLTLCGYNIRFETRRSDVTRLTYCTTGVVLRRLQDDPCLRGITHVVVDEVHERSMQSDFLLIILLQLLNSRSDLHIVLMSATVDSGQLSRYFLHCPVITVPGRSYSVEVYHIEDVIEQTGYTLDEDSPCCLSTNQLIQEERTALAVSTKGGHQARVNVSWTKEDISSIDLTELDGSLYSLRTRNIVTRLKPHKINVDLIVDLLKHIDTDSMYSNMDGAVLIFMPGLSHIQQLYETLKSEKRFADKNRYKILALHSVLSSDDQSAAFVAPPSGVRKVVIATNIAETGITIPDVVFVIDTGKAKELRYLESSQMSTLDEVFVSKASAKQRQGRAGRVREGICFRLYTKMKYDGFPAHTVPEIQRVPLEELCLHVMKCELGSPEVFLTQALEPPSSVAVVTAMRLLREIGACYHDDDRLTSLGQHLAALPVHVRLGKMLLFGAMLGCLQQVAIIAAAMTVKSPFSASLDKRDESLQAKQSLAIAQSDHLTLYRAFIGWLDAKRKGKREETSYCRRHCLKVTTLMDIDTVRHDLVKLVQSIGFHDDSTPSSKLSNDRISLLKAVLVAGLYPNVATVTCSGVTVGEKSCVMKTSRGEALPHRSSVNSRLQRDGWVVFHEKMKQSQVYICDSTLVHAYPLLLFGGQINVQHTRNLVTVDNWLTIKASARTGVIFREIQMLVDILLSRKLQQPALNISDDKLVVLLKSVLQSET